ncbi:MAG: type III-B CRISPR module RAMP protein Cmr6 [Puniceicoccales bacterium]|jgi:CRISPR type III-B/RAMP module RAMP protein Cmr6|nr:type III-B CRISPR module RAMP protein Cmr6 [Puniceicoccales bacterium]
MPPPVLKEIAPLLAQVESASLRHGKLVAALANATKRGEIEAVIACHRRHAATRIPPVTPRGALTFSATLGGRLIVNQAGGILENAGLNLHPHFNDPFIPGSAVKGIAAHAAWCEWNDESDAAKKTALARDIAAVFGFPTSDKSLDAFLVEKCGFQENDATGGAVAFLAAIPTTKPALVLEITNSHHMKYYGGGTAGVALDNEEPNPQFFPAVADGTPFRFTLAPLRAAGNGTAGAAAAGKSSSSDGVHAVPAAALLPAAKRWLVAGLTLNGVGAKTAAGYGWFIYDEAADQKAAAAEAAAARQREQAAAFAAEKAALPVLDDLPPETLRPALADVEAFLKKWKAADWPQNQLQPLQDDAARNRKRLPQASPADRLRERWETQNVKAIINGELVKFARMDTAGKEAVVLLLREPDGVGAEVWRELKQITKGAAVAATNDIRAHCKNVLKLGKMP